jgi:transposase InsO family protein
MALTELPEGAFPVHHSDRGCQYCSHLYVGKLTERGLTVRRPEEAHCYENAKAERLNGILKQEYSLGCSFRTKKQFQRLRCSLWHGKESRRQQALAAIGEAVFLYNTRRPHLALNYETPEKKYSEAA